MIELNTEEGLRKRGSVEGDTTNPGSCMPAAQQLREDLIRWVTVLTLADSSLAIYGHSANQVEEASRANADITGSHSDADNMTAAQRRLSQGFVAFALVS